MLEILVCLLNCVISQLVLLCEQPMWYNSMYFSLGNRYPLRTISPKHGLYLCYNAWRTLCIYYINIVIIIDIIIIILIYILYIWWVLIVAEQTIIFKSFLFFIIFLIKAIVKSISIVLSCTSSITITL
jgi:hypothetical protein